MIQEAITRVEQEQFYEELESLEEGLSDIFKGIAKLGVSAVIYAIATLLGEGYFDGAIKKVSNVLKAIWDVIKHYVQKTFDAEYKLGDAITQEQTEMIINDLAKLKSTLKGARAGSITRLENQLSVAFKSGNTKSVGKLLMKGIAKIQDEMAKQASIDKSTAEIEKRTGVKMWDGK